MMEKAIFNPGMKDTGKDLCFLGHSHGQWAIAIPMERDGDDKRAAGMTWAHGCKNHSSNMIYTIVPNRGGAGVGSPMDNL